MDMVTRPQNSALSPRCWVAQKNLPTSAFGSLIYAEGYPDLRGRVRQFGDTATRLQGRPMSGPSVPPEILSFFHGAVAHFAFYPPPVTGTAGPCTDHLVTRRQGLSMSLQISHLALRRVTNRNAADELVRLNEPRYSTGYSCLSDHICRTRIRRRRRRAPACGSEFLSGL